MNIKVGDNTLAFGRGAEAAVMAIINITPDSFFEGSRADSDLDIGRSVRCAVEAGASIIDLGGYSSRPGATHITAAEEIERLMRGFKILRAVSQDMPVSIDTFRVDVVEALYDSYGPFVVNDISAGALSEGMLETVGRLGLPYIAMHMRGTPQTMAGMTHYDDLVAEVRNELREVIVRAEQAGIKDIIIDPGFGFAKSVEHNFALLSRMDELLELGRPILVGLSRKSMIWRTLDITPNEALLGTAMLNFEALARGASILRVHDVEAARQAVRLFGAYRSAVE